MSAAYWRHVVADGFAVPTGRPLGELTADLTTMLGSPEPAERETTAVAALTAWVDRGVYDDLMAGLGDGMAAGLVVGLGEVGTDTVFRRSTSVRVLTRCLDRDRTQGLVPEGKVLEWGDRVAGWFLRERDLRDRVPGKGWAHALAFGADAVAALARSPRLGVPELVVLLDVLADRVLLPVGTPLTAGEPDRMAAAAMAVLRRELVPRAVVEPWLVRLAAAAGNRPDSASAAGVDGEVDPDRARAAGHAEAFLRALHLQLALAPDPPALRPDLLLSLVDALRSTNPGLLGSHSR